MSPAPVLAFLSLVAFAAQPEPPSAVLSGHVYDSLTGSPVRKASVRLQHTGFELDAETNSEGYYAFTGLPAGVYRLSVLHPEFHEQRSRQPVQVAAGAQVTHHPFRLSPFASLSGRILDDDGEPAPGATAYLYRYAYQPGKDRWNSIKRAVANERGEFRFTELPPGRYAVEAGSTRRAVNSHYNPEGAPLRPYLRAFYPNAFSLEEALPIVLDRGQDVRGIDIQLTRGLLPPAVTLRGRATLPDAPPTTRIAVSLHRDPGEKAPPTSASMVTEYPEFAFELRVPPGRYRLGGNVYSGAPHAFAAEDIEITGPVEGLVLPLQPAPRVTAHATILQGGSADFTDARVQLFEFEYNRNVHTLTADAAGHFSGGNNGLAYPGAHAVIVVPESLPEGLYFHALRLNGQEVLPDSFDLRSNSRLEVVLSRNAANVSGIAISGEQVPLPGTRIVLVPLDPAGRPVARYTGEDGHFAFTNLRPGKYQLLVWDHRDNDLWQDPDLRANYQNHTTTVELAPGASLTVNLLRDPE